MEILDSSAISWVEYIKNKLLLKIRYTSSDTTYIYHKVPLTVYKLLLRASSKGNFVNRFIKRVYNYSLER